MDTVFGLDAAMLSRIQFAFTITWHIIFPGFSIGLAGFIAVLEGIRLWTKDDFYYRLARFWTKVFAISFGLGTVSGVTMSYQFGLNWSRFSEVTGNIIAPMISYEVMTAFFLEATFLGVMLFGGRRISPRLHFFASLTVATGTLISASWIMAANSWMQFPTGYIVGADGVAIPKDWWDVIFSPYFPIHATHMVLAAYLTTSIVVIATGARYMYLGTHERAARTMLKLGLGLALVFAPMQAMVGDMHGQLTARLQPAKLAALEAHWEKMGVGTMVVIAWPSESEEKNLFEIGIPHLGSLIIFHDWNKEFPGLKSFAKEDRPPIYGPFFGFRIMVGVAILLILLVFSGGYLWWRGRLETSRRWLYIASWCWPLGFIAIIAGWFVTEQGRQPWIVNGLLRTKDAVSPVAPQAVATSLFLFLILYIAIFGYGIYLMYRILNRGPQSSDMDDENKTVANVKSPMVAAGLGLKGEK